MTRDDKITDMLQAALSLAKDGNFHFLCYLIEIALLELTLEKDPGAGKRRAPSLMQ